MSQENVEVVRAWLDAWVGWFNSDRDPDRLAIVARDYMASNVIYEEDPVWPDAGTYRGLDAVLHRFADYIDLVHIQGVEPGEVLDAGDLIVAEVRIAMLGANAGEAVEFLWTYTLRVEEGRIAHFRAWYDQDQALDRGDRPPSHGADHNGGVCPSRSLDRNGGSVGCSKRRARAEIGAFGFAPPHRLSPLTRGRGRLPQRLRKDRGPSNGAGRRTAQDVEVLVTAFFPLGEAKELNQPPLDARPLPWSYTAPVEAYYKTAFCPERERLHGTRRCPKPRSPVSAASRLR